jgi:hypothetical protein
MNYGSEYKGIRPEGNKDRNDCTVVAVSVLCDIPYEEASAKLAAVGRIRNKGLAPHLYQKVMNELGFVIRRLSVKSKTVRTLERELAANYGDCRCMIHIRRHVLAWNGREIVDWSKDRQHRIDYVDLVYRGAEGQPLIGKSVPMAPQKKAKVTSRPISAVEARIDGGEWTQFRSVKAAYDGFNIRLNQHQRVRKSVKYWGHATHNTYLNGEYHPVTLEIRLVDQSKKQNQAPSFDPEVF